MSPPVRVLGALLGLALAGCVSGSGGGPEPDPPAPDAGFLSERIPLSFQTASGPVAFEVEIADSPEERARGMMFRTGMDADHGMLFVFPDEAPRSFWMRNTLIPLDMVFVKADRSVLGIVANATPRTDTGRGVPGASQFVVELNGGTAAARGIREGDTVEFYAPIPPR